MRGHSPPFRCSAFRYNKMLPKKHFDKIEKDAIDQISSTAKPITKEDHAPPLKKVIEIEKNLIDKSTKMLPDDDDAAYDYYADDTYDDDTDNDEDIVTVTQKPTTSTTTVARKYKC